MFENLPTAIVARLNAAAAAQFESPETFVANLLDRALPGKITRRRNGGKEPAPALLRPVKSATKRARVLSFFMESRDPTVRAAMERFGLTRNAVFAVLTGIHFSHGVGYAFDAITDTIAVKLPSDCGELFTN